MFAYELMRLAAENPEKYEGKKYKVVSGSFLFKLDKRTKSCLVKNGKMRSEEGYIISILPDTCLEEILQEVDFITAVKAFQEGKNIKCVRTESGTVTKYIYSPKNYDLSDTDGRSINPDEILTGKWYIWE